VDAALRAGDPSLARPTVTRALELRPGDAAVAALARRIQ
jgi:hypothetical protein